MPSPSRARRRRLRSSKDSRVLPSALSSATEVLFEVEEETLGDLPFNAFALRSSSMAAKVSGIKDSASESTFVDVAGVVRCLTLIEACSARRPGRKERSMVL